MEKRKDKRGRLLRTGETQDKDGRYCYKWIDASGKRRAVYSWKLTASDPIPQGKRNCIALRDQEKQIAEDLQDGISCTNMTALELFEQFMKIACAEKTDRTKESYHSVLTALKQHSFGNRRIDKVTMTTAKQFCLELRGEGKKCGTVKVYKTKLSGAFDSAVKDGLIRKNPFDFKLSEIMKNDTSEKDSFTPEQEREFLGFIQNDDRFSKYYDCIFIMLNTGVRISEFCGITRNDIDFANHSLSISKQLLKANGKYCICPPKTGNGNREIPLTADVEQCLKRIYSRPVTYSFTVDGCKDFLSYTTNNTPCVSTTWESRLSQMIKAFDPDGTLHITPHSFRHTFCSKLVNSGMNPKAVAYIMGHSNCDITLKRYTHTDFERVQQELLCHIL